MSLEGLDMRMIDYLLETLRKEKNMTLDDVATRVYGSENIPQSRLRLYRLRKPKPDGTIKKLTLEDFFLICLALDEDPVRVLDRKLDEMREALKAVKTAGK